MEYYRVWYVAATAIGASLGALVNFLLNRVWSFAGSSGGLGGQAGKYLLVSAGSLVLNSGGVWYLTESWNVPYGLSKLSASICVAFFFNFPLHRRFVFR